MNLDGGQCSALRTGCFTLGKNKPQIPTGQKVGGVTADLDALAKRIAPTPADSTGDTEIYKVQAFRILKQITPVELMILILRMILSQSLGDRFV